MVVAVDAGHAACANSAKPGDVTSGKAANVGTADVATAEAADVATAETAYVAAAEAAAAAMATAATASSSSGLCARRKQASGEHCACQNHHRFSFHDILHLDGRMFRHSALSDIGTSQRSERRRRDRLEM
jgi:hypothetical protein